MEVSGYVRGVPTYESLNGKTYGMLCETKEKCITDDTGVALDFKLEELQKQIDSVGNGVTGMVNGTQKVGNADKLDGYDSSHFATAASVTNITNGTTQVGNAKTLGGNTSDAFAKKTDLANYLPLDGTAESAKSVSVYGGNEINFKGFTGGTGMFFNYRDGSTNQANTKSLDWFRFGSGLANGVDAVQIDMTKGAGTLRDILHTGNMADHVLPKTGGTVKTSGNNTITNESTSVDMVLNRFVGASGALGYFGFNGVQNPVYVDNSGNSKSLHHDGNSAKVIISETAPSDTSALWVW